LRRLERKPGACSQRLATRRVLQRPAGDVRGHADLMVGACAIGVARAAYDYTLELLEGREEAGVPLLEFQRVQQVLADCRDRDRRPPGC